MLDRRSLKLDNIAELLDISQDKARAVRDAITAKADPGLTLKNISSIIEGNGVDYAYTINDLPGDPLGLSWVIRKDMVWIGLTIPPGNTVVYDHARDRYWFGNPFAYTGV